MGTWREINAAAEYLIWAEMMGVITYTTVTKPVDIFTQNELWGNLGAHFVVLPDPKL